MGGPPNHLGEDGAEHAAVPHVVVPGVCIAITVQHAGSFSHGGRISVVQAAMQPAVEVRARPAAEVAARPTADNMSRVRAYMSPSWLVSSEKSVPFHRFSSPFSTVSSFTCAT